MLRCLSVVTAVVLLTTACTGDGEPSTPEPTSDPETPAPIAATLDSLELPEGCQLFDEGRWNQPIEANAPASIELRVASCARQALESVPELLVEWRPSAFDDLTAGAILSPSGTGQWSGRVTFTEAGMWRSDPRLGIGSFVDVVAADPGLVSPSPNLPLPAAPQTVAVLDGGATEILRTFTAELGGVGLLRGPDRAVFVQAREGGRWLVTGNIETGDVEPLFEVGMFTNVYPAPDGRAVAVEWGVMTTGVRELRIVTADGDVATIDDGTINHMVIAWAPDSSALLVRGDSLWVLGPDGAVRERLTVEENTWPQVTWSGDSTYALIWYGGQEPRLLRLDLASLEQEELFGDIDGALTSVAVSPSGSTIALGWRQDAPEMAHVSVVPAAELGRAHLDDAVIASFGRDDEAYFGIGGLTWSQDERQLVFSAMSAPSDGAPGPAGSVLHAIDAATGVVRRIAEAPDFYSGQPQHLQWTNDGTLFALRYNCSGCEPSSSSVDVIDVAASRVGETFEDTSLRGTTEDGTAVLLSTPDGLVRADGRSTGEPLVEFPGGISFGPSAATLASDGTTEALVAVQVGVGRGHQVFAAQPDGSEVELLEVLDLEHPPSALLGAQAVVIRGEAGWVRHDLATGVGTPYAESNGGLEKFSFELSPSGNLALDRDAEGFAFLDATAPQAPALVQHREYPGGINGVSAWSADERRVAFGDGYAIGVFDLDSEQDQVFELDALGIGLSSDEASDRLWALTWTTDGVIQFATPHALWSLDPETGTAKKVVDAPRPGGFTQGTTLAYAPEGDTLVAGTQFGVFTLEGGSWRQLSDVGLPVVGGSLHWAPDGASVAFAGASGHTPQGIIVAPLDGSGAYRLVASGAGRVLGWLPDGRLVWVSATGGV